MSTTFDRKVLTPPAGCEESMILEYRDRVFQDYAVRRSRELREATRDLLYYMGRQWITPTAISGVDEVRGAYFRDVSKENGDEDVPRPVDNKCEGAVSIALAQLTKKVAIPKHRSLSRDPKVEAAAKAGDEAHNAILKDLGWPIIRSEFVRNALIMGTGVLKSWYDEPYTEETLVGATEAVVCSGCGAKFADQLLDADILKGMETKREAIEEIPEEEGGGLRAIGCPGCGGKLEPYPVGEEEAAEGTDYFGRPMGEMVARGGLALEVPLIHEIFPENNGLGVTPRTMRCWRQKSVRPLEWLIERYPEAEEDLEAEEPTSLYQTHPLYGGWDDLGWYETNLDSDIYPNHCSYYEVTELPSYAYPKGRRIAIAKDLILEDDDLLQAVDTPDGPREIPRVRYTAARCKPVPGKFYGRSWIADLVSPQNRLNAMDSQITDIRERMGDPNIWLAPGVTLGEPGFYTGGGAKYLTPEGSPINPNDTSLNVIPGELSPSGVYLERDRVENSIKQLGGTPDISLGEAGKNVTTTGMLVRLDENYKQRFGPFYEEITWCYQQTFEHQHLLLASKQIDDREYQIQGPNGEWERRSFNSGSLTFAAKIEVDQEAYVEPGVLQREAAREAILDGTMILSSPVDRKRYLKLVGLPSDTQEAVNNQIEAARVQWTEFKDQGLVPVVDEILDAAEIRFEVMGNYLTSYDGRQLAEAAGWHLMAPRIAGWERNLGEMEALQEKVLSTYGGYVDKAKMNQRYAELVAVYNQELALYKQQQAMQQQAQSEGVVIQPTPMVPPQQPVPPLLPPQALQDKIYLVWTQMLARSAQPDDAITPAEPLPLRPEQESFLKFRAVLATYKVLAERKMGGPVQEPGSGVTDVPEDQGKGIGQQGPPKPGSQPAAPPQVKEG